MKKVQTLAIVGTVVVLATLGVWYFSIRPQNIRSSCAAKYKSLSNTETRVSRSDITAFIESGSNTDLQRAYDSKEIVYTGAYDKAYNSCLHEQAYRAIST